MKKEAAETAQQPKHNRVLIESTQNGYVISNPDAQRNPYCSAILASFESFASLTQWLKKNMVQR